MHIATRAVTPKPVKQLQRAAHPVSLAELKIEDAPGSHGDEQPSDVPDCLDGGQRGSHGTQTSCSGMVPGAGSESGIASGVRRRRFSASNVIAIEKAP